MQTTPPHSEDRDMVYVLAFLPLPCYLVFLPLHVTFCHMHGKMLSYCSLQELYHLVGL
jgi:hypothetical protein